MKKLLLLVIMGLVSLMPAIAPNASSIRTESEGPHAPPIPSFAIPPPTFSVQNMIHEFYAAGIYRGRSVRIELTDNGGYILYRGVQIDFVGWYSQYWEAYDLFLVHLVSVNENNFYIAYLYLTEYQGYKWIGFWIYSYTSMAGTGNPSEQEWVGYFLGDFSIGEPVPAPSVEVPEMEIQADFKTINHLYSDGPYITMNAFGGYTAEMTLYPLLTYLYVYDPSMGYWHELWTLAVDASGNYYYAIFYMYEIYPTYVLQGYTLSLTDYSVDLGYTWQYSPWWYQPNVNP